MADLKEDATFRAICILIDSLPASARALLRAQLIEQGVTPPACQKSGRQPRQSN